MTGMTLQHCQEARAALRDELEQAQAENERLVAQLDAATKELVLQVNRGNKAQARVKLLERELHVAATVCAEMTKTLQGSTITHGQHWAELEARFLAALAEGDSDDH